MRSSACQPLIGRPNDWLRSTHHLRALFDSLQLDPTRGTAIGKGCYKVRMAIASKKQGKSGGARVLTFVKITQEAVYLLALYDKSEKETLTASELEAYLELINEATE